MGQDSFIPTRKGLVRLALQALYAFIIASAGVFVANGTMGWDLAAGEVAGGAGIMAVLQVLLTWAQNKSALLQTSDLGNGPAG